MEADDTQRHICSICMQLLYLPQLLLACRHTFCKECVDTLFEMAPSPRCPMCRAPLNRSNISDNRELAAEIERSNPEEYAARRRAYESIDRNPTIFVVHNTATKGAGDTYHWTFFVRSSNNDEQKYIDRVVVHLHPTFNPSTFNLRSKPFELQCSGWGVFQIRFTVHWKEQWQRDSQDFTYMLTFHPDESNQSRIVKRFRPGLLPPRV